MTAEEMITKIMQEIGQATSDLSSADYANAIDDAQMETWDLPTDNKYRVLWIKKRAKRHLFFYLASGTARKFQVENFRLQQRHEHYRDMYKSMDREFEEEKKRRPEMFPEPEGDIDAYKMFGTQIDSGFQYDDLGRDTTYSASNSVLFKPGED
jgi:hypothetical protein